MSTSTKNFVLAEEEYFSIDDILATSEKVPATFEYPVHNMGYLDPSSDSPDLLPGTKLELPLWLAQGLYNRRIVSLELPKNYRKLYREILEADANVVDLHKLGPYFYHFGLYLLRFHFADVEEVSTMLNQTFRNRFRHLMDSSHNSLDEDKNALTSNFDRTELALFNLGQKSLYELQHWQTRKLQKIATADMVVNHKKRKRAVLEAEDN